MDKGALQYYKGIARGRNPREGGWWGLVDAQLKAAGHEGLNTSNRPSTQDFLTGKDKDGNTLPDPRGSAALDRNMARAMEYPSDATILYVMNQLNDSMHHGKGVSIWDQPQNLKWRDN